MRRGTAGGSAMKVLVTGASGFVGGRIMARYADRDHLTMHGVGRRLSSAPRYSSIDLAKAVDGILDGLPWTPDAVIHCAAKATPYGSRASYVRDNVEATRNVVELCRRSGFPRLVYVSSSSVLYRDGDQVDLTEDAPVGPRFANVYAETKAAGEDAVRGYEGSWVIARPRAVFGPGDTVLFPRILAAATTRRLPRLVRDGAPARGDLIYVDNLADYLVQLAHRDDLRGCIHLTNNEPVVIQDLVDAVLSRLGLPLPTRRVPVSLALAAATATERAHRLLRLRGEPPVTRFGVGVMAWSKTFDVTRMIADLGPPPVSINEGIEAFVAWQRERL
jgi:2-alkyl-3-oxoalkanoate reductase